MPHEEYFCYGDMSSKLHYLQLSVTYQLHCNFPHIHARCLAYVNGKFLMSNFFGQFGAGVVSKTGYEEY